MNRREHAMKRPCPECHVKAGERCLRVDGTTRKGVHMARTKKQAPPASKGRITQHAIRDSFRESFEIAGRAFTRDLFERVLASEAVSRCESPIESRLLAALVMAPWQYDLHGRHGALVVSEIDQSEWFANTGAVQICPQCEMADARLDFLISAGDRMGRFYCVAVECDGHDYHNSPEQMERDRARDRRLLAGDCATFRFTGAEIWRDPLGCAAQVADYVNSQIEIRAMWRGKRRELQKTLVDGESAE